MEHTSGGSGLLFNYIELTMQGRPFFCVVIHCYTPPPLSGRWSRRNIRQLHATLTSFSLLHLFTLNKNKWSMRKPDARLVNAASVETDGKTEVIIIWKKKKIKHTKWPNLQGNPVLFLSDVYSVIDYGFFSTLAYITLKWASCVQGAKAPWVENNR